MAVCAACGQGNPAVARFCLACGTSLDRGASRTDERKVVTVLVCDMVGYTPRSELLDPEEVRATLHSYYSRLRHEIERFGGTVEKFVGDAVIAIFGAPVAHDDDPERAVWAAFATIRAIKTLNEDRPGLDLAVRIGIHTAETLVIPTAAETGEGLATGDVVTTAVRLQALAQVGGIVVSEATHRATLHMADYEALPPAELKGKAEPTALWRAVALKSRRGPEVENVQASPMIDRDEERLAMINLFLRTVEERSLRLLTLAGEAGLGKTRLVGELFRFVDKRPELTYWRQSRCLAYGDSLTFWPLAQIVKAHAGILESDGPEVWSEKLDAALRALPLTRVDRDWIRARLGALLGEGGREGAEPTRQAESFTAWRRFLEAVASVLPLVLVIEDIHWAGEPMLDFLEHLVMGDEDVPMLLLCTARPGLFDRRPAWGTQRARSSVLRLGPLSDDDVRQLLNVALDPGTTSALIERAGGNPLFAREFARLLRDRAADWSGGSEEAPARPLLDVSVPDSIASIIAARLDELPPVVKSVLQDASVIGKVFWSGTLAAIGGTDESTVLKSLRELSRRELVSRFRTSRVRWNEEFAFSHVLVRDVAYGQIPRAARAAKHRAVAEWLELAAGDPRDIPELLAYHYGQALELARDSGVPIDGLEDQYLAALLTAGDRAMSLDVGRAADYYHQVIELMAVGDQERPRALTGFADAAVQVGRFSEAEVAYEEAINAFRLAEEGVRAGDAMGKLSNLLWHRGDVARSATVLDEAVELLESGPSGRELGNACSEVGWARMLGGDLEAAVAWSERALDISSREGLLDLRPRALALRGQARCHLGDVAGIEDIRDGLDVAIELGLTREAARCNEILAEELVSTDGPAEAAAAARLGIELAEGRGVTYMATGLRALALLPALVLLGEWSQALAEADAVMSWSTERGGGYFAALARTHATHARLWLGELEDAVAEKAEAAILPGSRDIREPQVLVPALAVGALLRTAAGRTEAAHDLVAEFVSFEGDPGGWIRATYLPELGRVCRDGRPDLAAALIEGVNGPTKLADLGRLTARACVDEAEGRLEAAAARYAKAAEGWGLFGALALKASSRVDEGRCLIRLGREEGAGQLTEGRDLAERLGAKALQDEAAKWLAHAAHTGI
jgi:class 3 adenylate cyclase/tetratricopeptide (TPR) repeat protein